MKDNKGWILLHRSIMDKPWYRKVDKRNTASKRAHLWITILMLANHEEREETFEGTTVKCKRGQFTCGRDQLSIETGINSSSVERLLKKMEIEQEIEQQTCSGNRMITVLNYDKFQKSNRESNNNRTTIEQQSNNNRTHSKELEEHKELEEAEEGEAVSGETSSNQDSLVEMLREKNISLSEVFKNHMDIFNTYRDILKSISITLNEDATSSYYSKVLFNSLKESGKLPELYNHILNFIVARFVNKGSKTVLVKKTIISFRDLWISELCDYLVTVGLLPQDWKDQATLKNKQGAAKKTDSVDRLDKFMGWNTKKENA